MNKEQQELLDEAYENYLNNFIEPICPPNLDVQPDYYKPMTKEWFIKSTKENNSRGQEFSEKWGLKIEERVLTHQEKMLLLLKIYPDTRTSSENVFDLFDRFNIPTKLITITYKNKTIESYE